MPSLLSPKSDGISTNSWSCHPKFSSLRVCSFLWRTGKWIFRLAKSEDRKPLLSFRNASACIGVAEFSQFGALISFENLLLHIVLLLIKRLKWVKQPSGTWSLHDRSASHFWKIRDGFQCGYWDNGFPLLLIHTSGLWFLRHIVSVQPESQDINLCFCIMPYPLWITSVVTVYANAT